MKYVINLNPVHIHGTHVSQISHNNACYMLYSHLHFTYRIYITFNDVEDVERVNRERSKLEIFQHSFNY